MTQAFYRVSKGSNGFLYADHNVVVGAQVTALFWLRIGSGATAGTQFVHADTGGLGLFVTISGDTFGFTVYGAGSITEAATTRAVDTWYLVALVNNTATGDVGLVVDGVSVGTANTMADALDGIFWIGGDPALVAKADVSVAQVAYYDSIKGASLADLAAAGVEHPYDTTTGAWTGEVPPLWFDESFDGTLPDGAFYYPALTPSTSAPNSGDGSADARLAVYRSGVTWRSFNEGAALTPRRGTPTLPDIDEGSTAYRDMLLELLPRGPIWDGSNPGVEGMAGGLGVEAVRLHRRLVDLMLEAYPSTADELLAEWEEVFGLPLCDSLPTSTAARQAALAARVAAQGGQSRAYYIDLAWQVLTQSGYDRTTDPDLVTIEENPYGTPFRVSVNRVGDPLNGIGSAAMWVLHLPADTPANDADIIECLIGHYKPAHTSVSFDYDTTP